MKGSESGPVLVAGNPGKSRLLQAVRQEDPNLKMPPDGKLSDAAIAALECWIEIGLPWPDSRSRAVPRPIRLPGGGTGPFSPSRCQPSRR